MISLFSTLSIIFATREKLEKFVKYFKYLLNYIFRFIEIKHFQILIDKILKVCFIYLNKKIFKIFSVQIFFLSVTYNLTPYILIYKKNHR